MIILAFVVAWLVLGFIGGFLAKIADNIDCYRPWDAMSRLDWLAVCLFSLGGLVMFGVGAVSCIIEFSDASSRGRLVGDGVWTTKRRVFERKEPVDAPEDN